MRYRNRKFRSCPALTILEIIIALAIITIIFAAVLPQFRVIYNSWDSRQANTEVLQNGRVLIDHINRNLSKAVKITAVSESADTNGFIVFQDNDGNNWRYDINTTSRYVEFGLVGNLSDLAGPVSSLTFTCYDGNNFTNAITDGNSIRFVKAETTLVNSVSASRNKTLIASAYLRTNSNVGNWCAYNDCVFDPGLVGDGNDPCGNSVHYGDTNRITVYGIGTLTSDLQTSLGAVGYSASSGQLKNYTTGAGTGVTATLTQSGGVVWQPMVGSTWAGGYDTAVCTDAYNTFHGIVDMTGTIYYGSAGWWVDVNFTGLDPNKSYTFATSASRAKSTTDGEPNGYPTRLSIYTISGIDAATNASTPGTTEVNSPYSVQFCTGNNHNEGYVARWTGIRPGTDGSFKVRATATPSVNQAYAFDVFELQSVETIAQIAYPISYLGFTEAKVSSDSTSIIIPTPGSSGAVAILGSWATETDLTRTKESGTNRALIFIAHEESAGGLNPSLTSVTYGGQTMTKVIERSAVVAGSYGNYVAAFILNESGVNAASSGTFTVNWSDATSSVSYASVFLSNVDQTTSIGASASNGTTSSTNPITTSALSTNNGDMVIDAATNGNNGSYTLGGGFTEGTDQSVGTNGHTGVTGYKSATGANETPSADHSSTAARQVIIGFVVNVNEEVSGIEGDLLIAAVATDGSSTPFTASGWTPIDCTAYGTAVTLGAWWKIAGDPEPASYNFSWTGGQQAYGWMMRFTGHDANNPINGTPATANQTSATPTSPAVTTTAGCSLILRLGAFDDDDVNTLPEPGNPGLSGHTAITMDESAATATVAFVAAGTVASGTGAITPALPAGIVTDDILLLFLETSNQEISISSSNGGTWTAVANSPQSTGTAAGTTGARLTVFWSRYNGTQGAPTTSDSGDHQMGRIVAFRGVIASGDPWDVTAGGVEASTDTSGSIPGATTTVANTLIVAAIAAALPDSDITTNFGSWTNTNLTNVTERTDNTTSQNNGGGLGIATGGRAATGAYGNTDVTLGTAAYKAMMSIALKPGGTVSGGAGYVKQSTAGPSSGAPTFTLGSSNEARMLTIAIAPAGNSGYDCCGNYIQP